MENFKLILPNQTVGRILQILAKQPYDQVADIIDGIKSQVAQQVNDKMGAQQGVQAPAPNGAASTETH